MTGTATDRRQGITSSIAIKVPCRVATTGNITLSGEQIIDGVTVASGDRVLVNSQTDQTTNGIYYADTSTWKRAPDFDGQLDAARGTLVYVTEGTIGVGTWRVTSIDQFRIGADEIEFERIDVDSEIRSDLASTDSGKGAAMVALRGHGNVEKAFYWLTPEGHVDTDLDLDDPSIDWFEAFSAAFEFAQEEGFGEIFMRQREYGVSETIQGIGAVGLAGCGLTTSGIRKMGSNPYLVPLRYDYDPDGALLRPVYRDFYIRGQGNVSTIGANALDQAPAFIATQKLDMFRVRAYRCGGPDWYTDNSGAADSRAKCAAFIMANLVSGDNTNDSIWEDLDVESCYGDGVLIYVADGVAANTNALRVSIRRAFRWSGYAINALSARRSKFFVQQAEGAAGDYDGGDPGGQIYYGPDCIGNKGHVGYSESDPAHGVEYHEESYDNTTHIQYDVFKANGRPEVTVVDNSKGRNSWTIGTGENMLGIAQNSTGDYAASGIGAYHTKGKEIGPANTAAKYILLAKWKLVTTGADKQQCIGRITFGSRTNTTSADFTKCGGYADVMVRNTDDDSVAGVFGFAVDDANLRLVTLTYDSEKWIALAQDHDEELFRHAEFTGDLTHRLDQLFKIDTGDASDVSDYDPIANGMAFYGMA